MLLVLGINTTGTPVLRLEPMQINKGGLDRSHRARGTHTQGRPFPLDFFLYGASTRLEKSPFGMTAVGSTRVT